MRNLHGDVSSIILKSSISIVRVRATGICGSDIKFWRTGRVGSIVVKEPLGLGHESSGEVVEIGKNVKKLQVGDRVAIE